MKTLNIKKILIRLFTIVCIFAILGVLSALIINHHVKSTAEKHILTTESIPEDADFDCILVLGCGVYSNGKPSPMLTDRLRRGVELYKAGVAPKILMSGDHGRVNYDEVNTMRNYALEQGIPEEDIFMDHAGFSTYESMYRARDIFCAKKILIVTQEYHLYRAVYIANRLGLEASGINSDYRLYASQSYRDLREIAARCKDFFTCIFKPEPTFLGETIPVSGSGLLTID